MQSSSPAEEVAGAQMVTPVASGHTARHMVESDFEHKSDSRDQVNNSWVILSPGVQGKEASCPYLQHGKGLRREKAEKTVVMALGCWRIM